MPLLVASVDTTLTDGLGGSKPLDRPSCGDIIPSLNFFCVARLPKRGGPYENATSNSLFLGLGSVCAFVYGNCPAGSQPHGDLRESRRSQHGTRTRDDCAGGSGAAVVVQRR